MEIPAIQPDPRIAETVSQTRDQRLHHTDISQPAVSRIESAPDTAEDIQPSDLSMGETIASRVGIVPTTFVSSELIRDHTSTENPQDPSS